MPHPRDDTRLPVPVDGRSSALATVLDARPLVALGLQTALAGVPEAAGVLVVGAVPQALELVEAAVQRGRAVVVVVDDADHPARAAAALAAGARGVALSTGTVAELVEVVRRATAGQRTVASSLAVRLEELERLRALFTPRELEVLRLYATGMAAKSVARRMDVGVETVKTYLKRLREKARPAGVPTGTRLELAALARRLDLL
ncbi:DNA-binding response regulator, NarL/FixJ family, contains REC and HTH domains [Quadrisphaera granulorum]|uniref:DNA-binding NarL/FixJ family response regulator n=1 Tax=Quadrisphaera granulorum TaxID=317664 RepID=A0A316ABP9_9ACTN|nr:LuxR C-terminal-related transcriptional regulator [Quadrisphaera granulorum]PWJ55133.1 DNA-binding NarL/FixJ family response regulator [Quadrisphaera granulorum]SZE95642.1 DNA-binding response regulator, NarL/FixJ family, contains REC and HTH domains [Quadrisphaera granulorum]